MQTRNQSMNGQKEDTCTLGKSALNKSRTVKDSEAKTTQQNKENIIDVESISNSPSQVNPDL